MMIEELLKAIGEIKTEEITSKSANERTFNLVMKKINDTEKRKRRKVFVRIVSAAAMLAAIFAVLVAVKYFAINNHMDSTNPPVEESLQMSKAQIIVYVYESKLESQPITSLYASEMTKREVVEGEKIDIGSYNPAMSSVPGYPLVISNGTADEENDNDLIKINVDGGTLIEWDKETGKITEWGKEGSFHSGDNIFWSPIDNDTICKSVEVKVDLLKGEEIVDSSRIYIEEGELGTYTAEKAE